MCRIVSIALLLGTLHVEGRSLQEGYAGDTEAGYSGDTGYEEAPATEYAVHSERSIPYKVDLRLGCNCALHIPCYDLKTSDCVPTVCGYNGHVEFKDNTLPRYGHPASNYDDDAGINANFSAHHNGGVHRSLGGDSYDGLGAGYSNPVINGCKCPSGTTRCYACAEVDTGAKVWLWILVVIFLLNAACIARLTLTTSVTPTESNQFALGVVVSMTGILCLSALSYMCVALDTGYIVRPWDLRRVYYARYFDWLVTTTVMMFTMSFLGGGGPYHTVLLIVLDAAMVIMGFVAALINDNIKWLFFIIGFIAYVWIAVILLTQMKGSAPQTMPVYLILKWVIVVLFLLYPLVWLESEGIGNFCAGTEAILYGIIDLLVKLVFCGVVGLVARPLVTN